MFAFVFVLGCVYFVTFFGKKQVNIIFKDKNFLREP